MWTARNRGKQGQGPRILPWTVLILAVMLGLLTERMLRFNERYEEKLVEINELKMAILRAEYDAKSNGNNSELTAKLGDFESQIDYFKTRISEIKDTTAGLKNKLDAAERNIADFKRENAELKEQITRSRSGAQFT